MFDFDLISTRCCPFIELLRKTERGCFLFRGVGNEEIDIEERNYSVAYRKPRDMPISVHNKVNSHFERLFGWPVRNGLFCFGVKSDYYRVSTASYGNNYVVFPIGNFKYVYSPSIFDLYDRYMDLDNNNVDDDSFVSSIEYFDNDLHIEMPKMIDGYRSVEVMVNCDSYYLINKAYISKLIEHIW